jgi:hypothetical protein
MQTLDATTPTIYPWALRFPQTQTVLHGSHLLAILHLVSTHEAMALKDKKLVYKLASYLFSISLSLSLSLFYY